jgi:hypothetical protein
VGFVYVIVNEHIPGKVKIGSTERSVDERVSELSRATGVPGLYAKMYWCEIASATRVERLVHAALKTARVPDSREIFAVDVDRAITEILRQTHACGQKVLSQWIDPQVESVRCARLQREVETRRIRLQEELKARRARLQRDLRALKDEHLQVLRRANTMNPFHRARALEARRRSVELSEQITRLELEVGALE